MNRILLLLFPALFCVNSMALSQELMTDRVKLFLDCSNVFCDQTYIRSEINLVDFVTDRVAADVHLLITSQSLGSGGRQYQLIFYGQQAFAGPVDTLRFQLKPNYTSVEVRESQLKYMMIGLVKYIAQTEMIHHVDLTLKREEVPADSGSDDDMSPDEERDPWDYWVFGVGGTGNLNLDQNYRTTNLNGSFSANRTTEMMRLLFRYSYGKNKSVFEFESEEEGSYSYTVENSNWTAYNLLAWSLTDHWSTGYALNIRNSTFSNLKLSATLSPAIEYNIFPYKEVNNKYLTLTYSIDVTRNDYFDETIYDKTEEWLFGHTLRLYNSFNQRWGNLSGNITYTNYFHDWSKNSLNIGLYANVRVTGRLSFNVNFFGGLTRNQIFIPKGGASVEEVLARRRQLASGYNFGTYFGINYRFGSILNNFVNPRFNAF